MHPTSLWLSLSVSFSSSLAAPSADFKPSFFLGISTLKSGRLFGPPVIVRADARSGLALGSCDCRRCNAIPLSQLASGLHSEKRQRLPSRASAATCAVCRWLAPIDRGRCRHREE